MNIAWMFLEEGGGVLRGFGRVSYPPNSSVLILPKSGTLKGSGCTYFKKI